MLQPARSELQIIRYRCFKRGKTLRPTRVQLPIRPSQGAAVASGEYRIPVMIVLVGALSLARPGRIVLCTVDLDVDVGRDAEVKSTNTLHHGLLLEPDAGVMKPQPHEGLAVRVVERTDQRLPAAHSLRGAGEDRRQAMPGPVFVSHNRTRTRDSDVAGFRRKDCEQRVIDRDPPSGRVLLATRIDPVHADSVVWSQNLSPIARSPEPTRVVRHGDVKVLTAGYTQSVCLQR